MSQKNEDYMSYDEYLVKVKEGILTKDGHGVFTFRYG